MKLQNLTSNKKTLNKKLRTPKLKLWQLKGSNFDKTPKLKLGQK